MTCLREDATARRLYGVKIMLETGERAKAAAGVIALTSAKMRNDALLRVASGIIAESKKILDANKTDVDAVKSAGLTPSLIDRLSLDINRLQGIAEAVRVIIALPDPVGVIEGGVTRPNGLRIVRTKVPLGVVGMIFEARPNVTADASALCIKSGNACILRGGKEAINTNIALAGVIRASLEAAGLPADCVQLVEDTSHASAERMMRMNGMIDVLIPRGSAGLIRAVVENATVPVIETGAGNCHVYIDSAADLDMGANIILNAKTSRPSTCNAAETLLVHRLVAAQFLPMAAKLLNEKSVKLFGCRRSLQILGESAQPATEQDYATEYLDFVLAVKVVDDIHEAIDHIKRYSTGHSEAIVTESYSAAEYFSAHVDAAAVLVNASTRFTDGAEFGEGAEIGISTQKLHTRGPLGLRHLTCDKYIVYGTGQVRE